MLYQFCIYFSDVASMTLLCRCLLSDQQCIYLPRSYTNDLFFGLLYFLRKLLIDFFCFFFFIINCLCFISPLIKRIVLSNH